MHVCRGRTKPCGLCLYTRYTQHARRVRRGWLQPVMGLCAGAERREGEGDDSAAGGRSATANRRRHAPTPMTAGRHPCDPVQGRRSMYDSVLADAADACYGGGVPPARSQILVSQVTSWVAQEPCKGCPNTTAGAAWGRRPRPHAGGEVSRARRPSAAQVDPSTKVPPPPPHARPLQAPRAPPLAPQGSAPAVRAMSPVCHPLAKQPGGGVRLGGAYMHVAHTRVGSFEAALIAGGEPQQPVEEEVSPLALAMSSAGGDTSSHASETAAADGGGVFVDVRAGDDTAVGAAVEGVVEGSTKAEMESEAEDAQASAPHTDVGDTGVPGGLASVPRETYDEYRLTFAAYERHGWVDASGGNEASPVADGCGDVARVGSCGTGECWDVRAVLYAPLPELVRRAADVTCRLLRDRLAAAAAAWGTRGAGSELGRAVSVGYEDEVDVDAVGFGSRTRLGHMGDAVPPLAVAPAFYDVLECRVRESIAAASDTCSGAGRRTERAARARVNIARALTGTREALRGVRDDPPPRGGTSGGPLLVDAFMEANRCVYKGILEAVLPDHMGKPRSESGIDVMAGQRGRINVFPHTRVAGALSHIEAYFQHEVRRPDANGVEVVARVFLALVSVHPCPDGNGRASACVAAAIAEAWQLPPPCFTQVTNRIIRAYDGQRGAQQNMTPADAMVAVTAAMEACFTEDPLGEPSTCAAHET